MLGSARPKCDPKAENEEFQSVKKLILGKERYGRNNNDKMMLQLLIVHVQYISDGWLTTSGQHIEFVFSISLFFPRYGV